MRLWAGVGPVAARGEAEALPVERVRLEDRVGREDHRALDGVLELAHVARPLVALEHLERLRREPADLLADLVGDAHGEAVREQRDVARPVAQRRAARSGARSAGRRDPGGSAPAPRRSARSRFVVAMMRTSTLIGLEPPTRSNSCSWSTRSSFACRSSRISLISSSSSVPWCARSNAPSTRLIAPGERALLVAEQRALDEPFRQRRAVQLDERARRAGRSRRGWRARTAPCPCRTLPRGAPWRASARRSPPSAAAAGSGGCRR